MQGRFRSVMANISLDGAGLVRLSVAVEAVTHSSTGSRGRESEWGLEAQRFTRCQCERRARPGHATTRLATLLVRGQSSGASIIPVDP
ncbi:MAG: hypothetical protein ACYC0I_00490 [Acidimicrobiales bacterium]